MAKMKSKLATIQIFGKKFRDIHPLSFVKKKFQKLWNFVEENPELMLMFFCPVGMSSSKTTVKKLKDWEINKALKNDDISEATMVQLEFAKSGKHTFTDSEILEIRRLINSG